MTYVNFVNSEKEEEGMTTTDNDKGRSLVENDFG